MKTVLLAPLDPVHDNAIKLIKRRLEPYGYDCRTLPPGTTSEEIIELALKTRPVAILVSRTLGYQVSEILGRLVDLAEAAGLRTETKLAIGGMAITREIGAELGFDGCFVGELDLGQLLTFLGDPDAAASLAKGTGSQRVKPDILKGYTYEFRDLEIKAYLDQITDQILQWGADKTSPGVERAMVREAMLAEGEAGRKRLLPEYLAFCDDEIRAFYNEGRLPSGVRYFDRQQANALGELNFSDGGTFRSLNYSGGRTTYFVQYGTGCPVMDASHIVAAEAWGADGVIHFDPSWNAQREGLLEGLLSHEHDGTVLTLENLQFLRHWMNPATLWNVRGHRGLNTPETQLLAYHAGADLLKINIPYGGTAGGTDPERLTVDALYSIRQAARYGLPFDIPGNDELSGVPPHKTFAGILVMVALGLKLGAKPIPKPLVCYSPYMTISGVMDDNMVDMNIAKLAVWQDILDTPVWPGEPVGFMTHTPERVQSAVMTAVHVALAASQNVAAVTFASSDEAYSKGPISLPARIDTMRATRDMLRFLGSASFQPTATAESNKAELHEQICQVLRSAAERGDFVASLYEGQYGDQSDGLYPGRNGRGTVRSEAEIARA